MRKKILILPLLTLMFVSFLSKNSTEVSADSSNGYHVEQVFSDRFNKEELDSGWSLNGATKEFNYNGLHCISPVSYGSGPIINAATLSNKTQIKFTIFPNSTQGGSNISFNVGMVSPNEEQKEPGVDARIQLWDNQLVFLNYQHDLAVDQSHISEHVLRGFSGLYNDLVRTDVSLFIERKDNFHTEMWAEYKRNNEVVYSSEGNKFVLENPRYPNGYCGFFWDCVEMDLTNFEWYNDGKLIFSDDFSSNTLTYPSTDYNKGNFHVNNTLNETNVYISKVSSILMDSGNESIVNSYKCEHIDDVTNPYELKYSLKINELNDSFFGFGFGMNANDTNIDANNAIGFIKNNDLTADVVAIRNGQIDNSCHYSIALNKLGIGKYQDYKIVLDYANNAYLTINGLTYKFSNIDFEGNIGVGVVSNANKSSSVELKEFILNKNVYNKYSSEDVSNTFKGIKPAQSDYDFDEPYINDQKYFLGRGVTIEEDWTTSKTSITFANAGPYSGFGYRKEYSEFICEFDLEVFSRKQGTMIGLSFGRKSVVDVLVQASTTNHAFIFRCDENTDTNTYTTTNITYGSNCVFSSGSDYEASNVNIFDPENTKYHLMFIGKNRTIYVYYKDIDAPDSEMGILRATIPNVNIDGYVSIVGNNNASFGVTNFKMVNLNDECVDESELTLREHFEDNKNVSKKISIDDSTVKDGVLVMNNTTIQTVNIGLFEIIRFTTIELENDLRIMFSNDKTIIINAKNNTITIKEDEEKEVYEVPELNLGYIKGKRFEIAIFGDSLSFSYKGYYDPEDKLHETVFTHKFKTPLEKDNIRFNANGKVVLDDLYIFALDNSYECATYDFKDDPNNANIWEIKPDFDPSKVYKPDGCNNTVSVSYLLFALCGISLVLCIKKKKEEER